MPTLADLIARHEARQPDPIALTPKAAALALARRLGRAIAELDDPLDRLDTLNAASAEALRALGRDPQTA